MVGLCVLLGPPACRMHHAAALQGRLTCPPHACCRVQKQSKSQKRREQRQREEVEREARIAAELAELGDTGGWVGGWGRVVRALSGALHPPPWPAGPSACLCHTLASSSPYCHSITHHQWHAHTSPLCPAADRVVEERELAALLRPLGLVVRKIPPDGHCLYRSLGGWMGRRGGRGRGATAAPSRHRCAAPHSSSAAHSSLVAPTDKLTSSRSHAEDQLARLPEGVPPPPAAGDAAGDNAGDELNFLMLRQRAAAYMRAHAGQFKPFMLPVGGRLCMVGVCLCVGVGRGRACRPGAAGGCLACSVPCLAAPRSAPPLLTHPRRPLPPPGCAGGRGDQRHWRRRL